MKPFDLQAAIAGAPIQYQDGRKLTFIAYVPEAKFGDRFVYLDSDGNVCSYSEKTTNIFMTPVFKKYWVSVYAGKSGEPFFGVPFDNEADATKYSNCVDGYLKTISFEIEQ
jgi:hypothetical protein